MSVDVQTYTLSREIYTTLRDKYSCPYLELLPNYTTMFDDTIELFLTAEETADIEQKLQLD